MEPSDNALGEEAGMPIAAMQMVAIQRLCKTCKHAKRPIGQSFDAAKCRRPGLPVNLVTGDRSFPCIIARGYTGLCGAMGVFWESK